MTGVEPKYRGDTQVKEEVRDAWVKICLGVTEEGRTGREKKREVGVNVYKGRRNRSEVSMTENFKYLIYLHTTHG